VPRGRASGEDGTCTRRRRAIGQQTGPIPAVPLGPDHGHLQAMAVRRLAQFSKHMSCLNGSVRLGSSRSCTTIRSLLARPVPAQIGCATDQASIGSSTPDRRQLHRQPQTASAPQRDRRQETRGRTDQTIRRASSAQDDQVIQRADRRLFARPPRNCRTRSATIGLRSVVPGGKVRLTGVRVAGRSWRVSWPLGWRVSTVTHSTTVSQSGCRVRNGEGERRR
jgi:hypothetical protein